MGGEWLSTPLPHGGPIAPIFEHGGPGSGPHPTTGAVAGSVGPLTWSTWVTTDGSPPFAFSAGATYQAEGNSFLEVVGGNGTCGNYCLSDWELAFSVPAGPTWFNGSAPGTIGRSLASLAWDAADGELVLFGGLNGTRGALNDTWTRVPYGAGWTELSLSSHPSSRWGASFTYDPALGGVVLFGGTGPKSGPLSDTWVFREGVWTRIFSGSIAPPARYGASMVWEADEDRLVLFGGNGSAGPLGDTWAMTSGGWFLLHPGTSPPARVHAGAATDAQGDPIVFSGRGDQGLLNDTWVFHDDNWTEPSLESTPEVPRPEEGALLVPDLGSTANDLLALWGTNGTAVLRDSWSVHVWNGGSPPPPLPLVLTASALPLNGTAPLRVELQGYATGGDPAFGYAWNFGDGSPGTLAPISAHTYPQPGNYLATISVRDSAVPPQTATTTVEVVVRSASSTLQASFNATPRSGPAPLTVNFRPSISGGGGALQYRWDFGDGSPLSSSVQPQHTYASSGTFVATLQVTDGQGDSASWSETVLSIGSASTVGLVANPVSGYAPLPVTFSASVNASLGAPTYWWDFGDGSSTSTVAPSVSHVYVSQGNFTARLTVVFPSGKNASGWVLVRVMLLPPPTPPPPTVLEKLSRALAPLLSVLGDPYVWGPLVAVLLGAVTYRWGRPLVALRRQVRRGVRRRPLRSRWGVGEIAVLVRELRRGSSGEVVLRKLRPLLHRDAQRAAELLRWHPGPTAIWATRRTLLIIPALLTAASVLFLGLVALPDAIHPPLPRSSSVFAHGPAGFLGSWWRYVSQLLTGGYTDPIVRAYLPYSLELLAVVVALSALLGYPLGLLSGWYRGRLLDQSTRLASVVAFSVPIFVVCLLTIGVGWRWYYDVTGGDVLLGSLPSVVWWLNNGGFPPPTWIGFYSNTSPTGFVLIDAPLHGAWALEAVELLKTLLQGLPIAAIYSAIFLRFARLATEEASRDPSIVGGRARGLSERRLLWSHASRRVSPVYASIFGTTFPMLLFVQMVAEWFYSDLGMGRAFIIALGNGPTSLEVGTVAFVVLLLIVLVNALGDGLSRALDPAGRSRGP